MTMTLEAVLQALEAAGTEQNRKIYRRHGASDPLYGVSFAELGKLKKRIKRDHALALGLWETGNLDARILATMVVDAQAMSATEIDGWLFGLTYHGLINHVASEVAAPSPFAREKLAAWTASPDEWVSSAGWHLLASLALAGEATADLDNEAYLGRIEAEIAQAPNRTRHEMNGALIAIGSRDARLRALAEAAARRIGPVHVDHGETGCKTPDAVPYLAKVWARKQAKALK